MIPTTIKRASVWRLRDPGALCKDEWIVTGRMTARVGKSMVDLVRVRYNAGSMQVERFDVDTFRRLFEFSRSKS